MNNRGQGLPISTIIIIALALLVLVVVGAFFVTGTGRQLSAAMPQLTPEETAALRTSCQQKCNMMIMLDFTDVTCGADLKAKPEVAAFCADECDTVSTCKVTVSDGSGGTADCTLDTTFCG